MAKHYVASFVLVVGFVVVRLCVHKQSVVFCIINVMMECDGRSGLCVEENVVRDNTSLEGSSWIVE